MSSIFEEFLSSIEYNSSVAPQDLRNQMNAHRAENFSPRDLVVTNRYLQLAFNGDISSVRRIVPYLPKSDRIILECGTPFIKKYGMQGVEEVSWSWGGLIVADIKTVDGAVEEVDMCARAGAHAVTVVGDAPKETLDKFIATCEERKVISMIDMIGVNDPLQVMRKLSEKPAVVILHLGRDEESNRAKMIQYRHVRRIKSKFDVLISAAGGVGLKESRSAIFNGANIVVVNIVSAGDPWSGIMDTDNVPDLARQFLETIE